METVDSVVIGAGVVGLACARALAQAGQEVVILEGAGAIGTGTSARNSGVIHAGIYYPEGSAKARLCRPGREALYRFCDAHGVDARRTGKLIVATDPAQEGELDRIAARARAAGVTDLQRLSASEARALEPEVRCAAALHSPSTGIVDAHGFMLALLGDAEASGAMLALGAPVLAGRAADGGVELDVGGEEPMTLRARRVVNAAGLHAQEVAASVEGLDRASVPQRHLARGVWFTLTGRQPFSRPVYPVPEPGGLGCHYTVELNGQGKFGPDVEWIDDIDYSVDAARAERFAEAIRPYWPEIDAGRLSPAMAGIRPKTAGPGGPPTDFLLHGPGTHGVDGLVCLYGIESPGLTAALAIAEETAAILR